MFFVYEDWTLEDSPRCYYVGKGSASRVRSKFRNQKHTRYAQKFGWRREVVLITSIEALAFEAERELITSHRTYAHENPWGCNFTRGGDGTSGHCQSHESRRKISEWRTGRPGNKHSPETKLRMSASKKGREPNNKGKRLSESTKEKMRLARRGQPKSEVWKRLMSERMLGNKNGKRKSHV